MSLCEKRSFYFYPRPPGGGRQNYESVDNMVLHISIHALRVEGDLLPNVHSLQQNTHFYPRPPGGGRLHKAYKDLQNWVFLSTPSGWRATKTG